MDCRYNVTSYLNRFKEELQSDNIGAIYDRLNTICEVKDKYAEQYQQLVSNFTYYMIKCGYHPDQLIKYNADNGFVPFAMFNSIEDIDSVEIDNHIKSIKFGAFENSGLTELRGSEQIKIIGENAFHGSKLRYSTAFFSIESIGDHAFSSTQISSLLLGDKLEYIGNEAFSNCTLNKIAYSGSTETAKKLFTEDLFIDCTNNITITCLDGYITIKPKYI